ncbi:MAG: VWA domain-containing protein [Bacteriovoracales bacterium]|nr:VWA domain-containing protein [Bacteriovoracales bacterium]
MSFVYSSWLIPLVFIGIFICFIFWQQEKKISQWVKDHWFFKRSYYSKWSFVFFSCAIILFFISMADFRGRPQNIKTKTPIQRTAILIDVSLSMFAEDIRPNRLEKAIQVAKHFIRKAFGHSISIMIFSDHTRQLIPFTEDIDLLDSRLSALKFLDLNRGGSKVRVAIQETLGHFIEESSEKQMPYGNIVIISDSDETFTEFDIKVPDTMTVAYIVVGTKGGGKIPLREKNGILRGYKKYKNKEVISKINEFELKKMKSSIKNFRYWILSSYSIPTEDIILYLKKTHHSKFIKMHGLVRPVLMEYWVVPAIILFIFSILLKMAPSYRFGVFLLFSFLYPLYSEERESSLMSDPLYTKFKNGEATKKERLKMAEKYLKKEKVEDALNIYEENLSFDNLKNDEFGPSVINYGISLMKNGQIKKGAELLNQYKNSISNDNIKKSINENIIALLREHHQKENQKSKKNNKKKNKNKENENDDQSQGQNKEEGKEKPNQKKDSNNSNGKKSDENMKKKDHQNSSPKDEKEDSRGSIEKRKKIELPTILNQLVDKDKKLQEKMLDTRTKSSHPKEKKDW